MGQRLGLFVGGVSQYEEGGGASGFDNFTGFYLRNFKYTLTNKGGQGLLIYINLGLPAVTWYTQVSTSFC